MNSELVGIYVVSFVYKLVCLLVDYCIEWWEVLNSYSPDSLEEIGKELFTVELIQIIVCSLNFL